MVQFKAELADRFLKTKKTSCGVGLFVDELIQYALTHFKTTTKEGIDLALLSEICDLVEIECVSKKYTVDKKIKKKELAIQIYSSMKPNLSQEQLNSIDKHIEDLHDKGLIIKISWIKRKLYKAYNFLKKKV